MSNFINKLRKHFIQSFSILSMIFCAMKFHSHRKKGRNLEHDVFHESMASVQLYPPPPLPPSIQSIIYTFSSNFRRIWTFSNSLVAIHRKTSFTLPFCCCWEGNVEIRLYSWRQRKCNNQKVNKILLKAPTINVLLIKHCVCVSACIYLFCMRGPKLMTTTSKMIEYNYDNLVCCYCHFKWLLSHAGSTM